MTCAISYYMAWGGLFQRAMVSSETDNAYIHTYIHTNYLKWPNVKIGYC